MKLPCLPCRPQRHHAPARYLQDATTILAADLALERVEDGAELGIERYDFLDQVEVVTGLILIICDEKAIVSLHATWNHQLKE